MTQDRAEIFLANLLNNPGKIFYLKKPIDNRPKKLKNKERNQIMLEIKTAIELMGLHACFHQRYGVILLKSEFVKFNPAKDTRRPKSAPAFKYI